jgi:hypothetical protein
MSYRENNMILETHRVWRGCTGEKARKAKWADQETKHAQSQEC